MSGTGQPAALDAVRCRVALGGAEEVAPPELWRLCRELASDGEAGDLYAHLLRSGEVVPVETPFGPRLGVTAALVSAAERALRATAPAPAVTPAAGETFATPTLLHDLLTLCAFVRREQPRVTGRGLLAAPALRRLEGLPLTADAVAPTLDRRSPAGTHVWQFLFHFLCAQGLVRLDGGRATLAEDNLTEAVAAHTLTFATLLFTFIASRRPVGDSGWLSALERPLPASWERRRLVAWLERVGAKSPETAVDRTGAVLEALGFARRIGGYLVLLASAAALWPSTAAEGAAAGRSRHTPPPPAPTLVLPGGGVAVDLASGEAALAARLPLDRQAAPESVGHILVYGAAAPRRLADGQPRLGVRLAAIVRGDDDAMLAAVAEAMGEAALARWPGGLAVEPLAMEEAIERLTRLGGVVGRQAPWAGDGGRGTGALPPGRAAALPWTLARAREGAWASDGSGAFRPLRAPAALSPAAAQALPSIPARLRAAMTLGWPIALRGEGGGERRALIADVRWDAGEERVTLFWLDARPDSVVLPVSTLIEAQLVDVVAQTTQEARA